MRHGPMAWSRGLAHLLGVRSRQATVGHRPYLRPKLELLEDRTVPAYLYWDGGGDGSSWFDPLNWDTDTVPGAVDDVYVAGSGSPSTAMPRSTACWPWNPWR